MLQFTLQPPVSILNTTVGRLFGESANNYGESADDYTPIVGELALELALELADYSSKLADSNIDQPKIGVWVRAFSLVANFLTQRVPR